jgi:hypothetical protein
MTEEQATDAKRTKRQLTLRAPDSVITEIEEFMSGASSALRAKINKCALTDNKQPHDSDTVAFLAYAVRQTLDKGGERHTRGFPGIDSFVDEVMSRNLEIHRQRPDNWWELTAIGVSLIRNAGQNPHSVKKWMEDPANVAMLAEHHASIGIDDPLNHNRKAGKEREKLVKQEQMQEAA